MSERHFGIDNRFKEEERTMSEELDIYILASEFIAFCEEHHPEIIEEFKELETEQ